MGIKIMVKAFQMPLLGFEVCYLLINTFSGETSKGVSFTVRVFDSRDIEVHQLSLTLSKEEYDAWGTDDNYIAEIILSRLQLERA